MSHFLDGINATRTGKRHHKDMCVLQTIFIFPIGCLWTTNNFSQWMSSEICVVISDKKSWCLLLPKRMIASDKRKLANLLWIGLTRLLLVRAYVLQLKSLISNPEIWRRVRREEGKFNSRCYCLLQYCSTGRKSRWVPLRRPPGNVQSHSGILIGRLLCFVWSTQCVFNFKTVVDNVLLKS